MALFVKTELLEATEFDVYLDVDGSAEGNEDVPSEGDSESASLQDKNAAAVGVSSQSNEAEPQTRPCGSDVQPAFQLNVNPPASFDALSDESDWDDEIEIEDLETDTETSLDEKQSDQTQPFVELGNRNYLNNGHITDSALNLAKKSNSNIVSKSAVHQSVSSGKVVKNVATKSTTPRQSFKVVSNVAKTSTSKQPQIVPQVNTKFKLLGPEDKVQHVRSVPGKFSFILRERSEDQMKCPECGIQMMQRSMRKHLRNIHNLFVRTCSKCKVSFSDLDMYSEHYALHLQHEENLRAGLQSHPLRLFDLESASPEPKKTSDQRLSLGTPSCGVLPKPLQSKVSLQHNTPNTPAPSSSKKQQEPSTKPASSSKKQQEPSTKPASSFSRFLIDRFLEKNTHPPFQLGSSPKAKNLPASRKRHASPSPAREVSPSRSSMSKESSKARRSSLVSLQSESDSESDASLSFDHLEPSPSVSTLHSKGQKVTSRKGQTVYTSYEPTPDKRGICEVITVLVSRRYCEEAKVSLVSLETASQPYDCKTCLAAYHTALACPRSFRILTQKSAASKGLAHQPHSNEPRTHQLSLINSKSKTTTEVDVFIETDPQIPSSNISTVPQETKPSPSVKNMVQNNWNNECGVCGKKFQYRCQLLKHADYHTVRYSCGLCKKFFKERLDIMNHFQISHEGRSRMLCRYCEREFEDFDDLDNHILIHKDGTEVACTVCDLKFSDSKLMRMHLKSVHDGSEPSGKRVAESAKVDQSPGKFTCKLRRQKVNMSQQLASHMRRHLKSAPDGSESSSKLVVERPKMNQLSGKSYACKLCSRKFDMSQKLASHVKCVHHRSPYSATKILFLGGSKQALLSKTKMKKPGTSSHKSRLVSHAVTVNKTTTSSAAQNQKKSSSVSPPKSKSSVTRVAAEEQNTTVSSPKEKMSISGMGVQTTGSKCQICGRTYTTRKGMLRHMCRLHSGSHSGSVSSNFLALKQKVCTKVKQNSKDLKTYHRMLSSAKVKNKTACNFLTKVAQRKKGAFLCRKCCKTFSLRGNLSRHLLIFHGKTADTRVRTERLSWECWICGSSFDTRAKMRYHRKISHNNKDLRVGSKTCSKCGTGFQVRLEFLKHKKICGTTATTSGPVPKTSNTTKVTTERQSWDCRICGGSFDTQGKLRYHRKISHSDLLVGSKTCRKCGMVFQVRTEYLDHIKFKMCRTTTTNGPVPNSVSKEHSCQTCGKIYLWRKNLVRHMQSHLDPKAKDSVLNAHVGDIENLHHARADLKFLCKVCYSCFTSKRFLRRHQMRVHGDKSGFYQCRYRSCGQKVFDRGSGLVKHIKTHHPNMSPFLCRGCKTGFDSQKDVYKHSCVPVSTVSVKNCKISANSQEKGCTQLQPSSNLRESEPSNFEIPNVKTSTSQSQMQQIEQSTSDSEMPKVQKSNSEVLKALLATPKKSSHRCPVCDLVFHTASEWTNHMQEHAVKKGAELNYQKVIAATENMRLNIFDTILGDYVCVCQLCRRKFSDIKEMALHACEKSKNGLVNPSFEEDSFHENLEISEHAAESEKFSVRTTDPCRVPNKGNDCNDEVDSKMTESVFLLDTGIIDCGRQTMQEQSVTDGGQIKTEQPAADDYLTADLSPE